MYHFKATSYSPRYVCLSSAVFSVTLLFNYSSCSVSPCELNSSRCWVFSGMPALHDLGSRLLTAYGVQQYSNSLQSWLLKSGSSITNTEAYHLYNLGCDWKGKAVKMRMHAFIRNTRCDGKQLCISEPVLGESCAMEAWRFIETSQ